VPTPPRPGVTPIPGATPVPAPGGTPVPAPGGHPSSSPPTHTNGIGTPPGAGSALPSAADVITGLGGLLSAELRRTIPALSPAPAVDPWEVLAGLAPVLREVRRRDWVALLGSLAALATAQGVELLPADALALASAAEAWAATYPLVSPPAGHVAPATEKK
jgi:hypothetical protein